MFAKLKKKIAEEAATTSRAGGAARMPRSISKESITSVGADSGDDFPSDGSSSREDLSSQLFRRNEQIRKLEVKLSDYAEQVRNLQKIKEKLEHALETHQDSFVKKLQEQNEAHQASAAKMAEGVALALEKKDQEWKEKLSHLEKERDVLSAQLQERTEQSLILFQKRDELDELEGFQQQELAKVKHMLLKKEESLALAQQELASSAEELACAREAARVSQAASSRLSGELQELKRQHADLRAERDELLEAEESAENKITTLERRAQELQTFIQRLSADLQHAQVTASDCKKRLETLQGDHESLKAEYEQHKQKAVLEAEEKARLVGLLQDKVATLEKRFEGNLSGDDHVRELLGEKSTLEERLEEARRQLSAARSSHAESVGLLETQIDRLSGQLAEGQARLSEQEELVRALRESRAQQQKDLERALRLADDIAAKSKEEVEGRDRQIQKLQTELELERTRLQEGLSIAERRWAEQVRRLEEQGAALEAARESERAAVQHERVRAERENEELRARCDVLESSLKNRGAEVERLTADLSNATERAKHLEEEQKQKEALQRQVADLTSSLKEKDALIAEKTDLLLKEEEALSHLRQGYEALLLQRCQLQSSLERCQHQAAEREAVAEGQRSTWRAQLREAQERLVASEEHAAALELASAASRKHSRPPEEGEGEPNGEVAATDVVQIQKENRDLEQQLAEKNKIIRQLQQRMAELKKTLQKELKIRPDGELLEVPGATLTVTNNSDLNDSREINFEYLKHVVLKFMSCRESEAFHLIKAVSVLLNFSKEEENMLKETLEYKMSWFGSKPPPRGSIRPSISNPRTAWS